MLPFPLYIIQSLSTVIVRQALQDFHSSVFLSTPAMLPDHHSLRVSVLDLNSVN